MKTLSIKGTEETPNIYFDIESKHFEINGRSLPEDVISFYTPVTEWLVDYSESPLEKTTLHVKLEYFNTATAKMILDIFLIFEDLYDNGYDVLVKWYFPDDDEDVEEAGDEFSEIVECPFELIPYEYDDDDFKLSL